MSEAQYPQLPPTNPPVAAPPTNHGRTLAAWVLFWFACAGSVVIAIGMIVPSMPVVWAGVIVLVVGVVASIALRVSGRGQPKSAVEPAEDDELAHLRSPASTS